MYSRGLNGGNGNGSAKRSPLARKPRPRRIAGQSLVEGRQSDLFDELAPWVSLPVFCWVVALMEWARKLWSVPPAPGAMAVVAVIATATSARRVQRIFRDLRAVRLGIWGERYVGQALEDICRPRGYRVLHDLPSRGGGFNVDHVLVGPEGVYAVETKHYARPTAGDQKIVYDGQSLKIPGTTPEKDLLVQAKSAADYVRDVLRTTTGRDVPVRPVLIFAGWYVEQKTKRPYVWVLNENHLPAYLDQEEVKLSAEDVALYADRLERETVAQ